VAAILRHQRGRLVRVLTEGEARGNRGQLLDELRAAGVPIQVGAEGELDRASGGERHQGLVGWVRPASFVDWGTLCAAPDPLLVAFDQVTDPHNFGAILRSAEAFGATGALITRKRCARPGPTVTRASAGAAELIALAEEPNLARALRAASRAGLQILGADLSGEPPRALDLTRPTVLVVGAEGPGLRRLTREACDTLVRIPLSGCTESLNASVAAGVLLYEIAQQRGLPAPVARALKKSE
jgi:23S rRNA (guanosine2251-2'-O)-methyltransferase